MKEKLIEALSNRILELLENKEKSDYLQITALVESLIRLRNSF